MQHELSTSVVDNSVDELPPSDGVRPGSIRGRWLQQEYVMEIFTH
jgi:hypothetical protein